MATQSYRERMKAARAEASAQRKAEQAARQRQIDYAVKSTGWRFRRSLMKMSIGVLDHYNVSTRKVDETVHFYENVLGFTNGPRPPFNFPGAWLYSSGHAVLHLNDISQTEKQQRTDLRCHRSCCFRLSRFRGNEAASFRKGSAVPSEPGAK